LAVDVDFAVEVDFEVEVDLDDDVGEVDDPPVGLGEELTVGEAEGDGEGDGHLDISVVHAPPVLGQQKFLPPQVDIVPNLTPEQTCSSGD
jgi:hypothetical protein